MTPTNTIIAMIIPMINPQFEEDAPSGLKSEAVAESVIIPLPVGEIATNTKILIHSKIRQLRHMWMK